MRFSCLEDCLQSWYGLPCPYDMRGVFWGKEPGLRRMRTRFFCSERLRKYLKLAWHLSSGCAA